MQDKFIIQYIDCEGPLRSKNKFKNVEQKFEGKSKQTSKHTLEHCASFFFLIVVQVQLSPFSPHHLPPPKTSPPPTLDPTPLWLCPTLKSEEPIKGTHDHKITN